MFTKVQDWAIARFIHSVNSNPEVYNPDRREADARLDLIGRLVVARAGLIGLILGLLLFGLAFFLYEHPSASGFVRCSNHLDFDRSKFICYGV